MECPHYEKVQASIGRNFVKGYCQGHPAAGMMIPSLLEERTYCLQPGGFLQCPIYRSTLVSPSRPKPIGELDLGLDKEERWLPIVAQQN